MSAEKAYKSLLWRSRRGMLELDVLLEPFTRDAFCLLSAVDKATYARLLACEDPDLFDWFVGDRRPEDDDLAKMVDKVMQRGRSKADVV
ncbi:MAG: succinate dehydrogenase assembly factor 2 [Endozoicomonas sp. (ex Botrylloides leachii)]|nr:succinate dehydrogenase assembly factor 2 [Endozoicomonas sp. (ex Botrylloides leachii)]